MPRGKGEDELVFVPLGGVGEIGMNLAMYGFGPARSRRWIVVDFGISFAGPEMPGVEIVFPDLAFLEEERDRVEAIVITHAHEDHYGALVDLWARIDVPVYASPFAAALIAAKSLGEPGAPTIPVNVVKAGGSVQLGPFSVEFVSVAHSIPEPMALAIRTPLGLVVHSGDWKIDRDPPFGEPMDVDRFRTLGEEGVDAFICDSTNALRPGRSVDEVEVAKTLDALIEGAQGRVVVTLFSSNVARVHAVATAAARAGREVVAVGRSLQRVVDVATELGMLRGLKPFRGAEVFQQLPRDKVVAILTGSQGEPRAALSRLAEGERGPVQLSPGDTVIFSSRTIPGNEKAVNFIINRLVSAGIKVITSDDHLVHASGHPRRDELADMYDWLKPRIAVPVHGEAMHLAAHAELARSRGVPTVIETGNGKVLRLAPGPAEEVGTVPVGRLYRDGRIIGNADELGISGRRSLAFAGHVAVAIVIDGKGNVVEDAEVTLVGIPESDRTGKAMHLLVEDAVDGTLDSIPRPKRRDPEVVREAVRRAVRAAVAEVWDKKPVCSVLVTVI